MTGSLEHRVLLLLQLPLIVACAGCSFSRAWQKAGKMPAAAGEISGQWEGRWLSEANGHNDKLRAIITPLSNGVYQAWFHAKYKRILGFKYKVKLDVAETGDLFHFTGQENLGKLAGGVYRYDGFATTNVFVADYRSKYDHGIFEMSRPGSAVGTPLTTSRQLLVVTTSDWDAHAGNLRCYSRADTNSNWTPYGSAIPVTLGKAGLGWGRGVHGFAPIKGPVKREGDGRSPAGIFTLGSAFGFARQDELDPIAMPYRQISPGVECIDDPQSIHYNEIVDRAKTSDFDWKSSEQMVEYRDTYRLGITVDHNTKPRLPGFGSCIFLHIWQDGHSGTSGCTAMASDQIEKLIHWLNPESDPLLVQVPEAAYRQLKMQWRLP